MHLQTRMARAPQQIDKHVRNADSGDDSVLLYSALLWRCLFFYVLFCEIERLRRRRALVDISQLPKVRRTP